MTDIQAELIQAARHLEAAADILRRAARPHIPATREGHVEDFLASGAVKPGPWTPASDIHATYETWCLTHNREALPARQLGRQLSAAGIAVKRGTNGVRLRNLAPVRADERSEPSAGMS